MGKLRKRAIRKMGFSNPFEKQVYDTLGVEFGDDKARVMHNCYFTWPSGKVSESDLVMITRRGVFVIECKDYAGKVEGTDSDGDYQWKHTVMHEDGTETEYTFLNPLYQNFMHIQCIRKNIDFADVPIYSLVVFADRCDISGVKYSRPDTAVTSFSRMCGQVVLLSATSRCMLTNDEIVDIAGIVRSVAGDPEEISKNKEKLITDRYAKFEHKEKHLYVRFKESRPTKKGLEPGQIYKVLDNDGECYRLEGIQGKTMKRRFEICGEETEK